MYTEDGTVAQVRDGVRGWDIDGRWLPIMAGGDGTEAPAAPAPVGDLGAPDAEPKTQETGDTSQPDKAKDKGTAPWAKDLADLGIDDPRVDEYLRSTWQPRMTQAEQRAAEYTKLFDGFNGDSDDPMSGARLAHEIAKRLDADPKAAIEWLSQSLLDGDAPEGEQLPASAPPAEETPPPDPRNEYVDRLMQSDQERQEQEAFTALTSELETKFPGFDEELFTTCLVANGDAEDPVAAATDMYAAMHKKYGLDANKTPTAPGTLGDGSPVAPAEPQYGSVKDAMDGFMAEDRARRAK